MAVRPENQSRAAWWIVAGAAGVLLLALGAIVFVNSFTTERALAEAEALRKTDLTLAAHDVAMKSIGQLVLLAEDAALEVATDADVTAAVVESQATVAAVGVRFDSLEPQVHEGLYGEYDAWKKAAVDVISQAAEGDPQLAAKSVAGSLSSASDRFVNELSREQYVRAVAVEDAGGTASFLGRVAGFFTIFLIPLAAILAYWFYARRQLQEAAAHLDVRVEAERSAAREKDEVIATVAKDLRTPLAQLLACAEELRGKSFVGAHVGELVDRIDQESTKLAYAVDDLIVAAHNDSNPLPLDIAALDMERELPKAIEPFRNRGHRIEGTWGAGSVHADQARMHQILRNLVANAVEHGGPDIRIFGDSAGSKYVVSVEDNGSGVPEEIIDRVLTNGSPTGDVLAPGATSLGLAVARSLADSMGGSLAYEPLADRTALVLSLPLAVERSTAIPALVGGQ